MSAEQQLAYWKRRARDAERQLQCEVEYNTRQYAWMHKLIAEEFRLSDRCSFLYGKAIQFGATHDDLRKP